MNPQECFVPPNLHETHSDHRWQGLFKHAIKHLKSGGPIISLEPPKPNVDLQGIITTKRKLPSYEKLLCFESSALSGQAVLNGGSGPSNLQRELNQSGLNIKVINLDLRPTREFPQLNAFSLEGDLAHIPLPSQSVDTALALWSTYQVPEEAKESVYNELMRVANTIRLGPIYQKDFQTLTRLAVTNGFDVITCLPFLNPIKLLKRTLLSHPFMRIKLVQEKVYDLIDSLNESVTGRFIAKSVEDYTRYQNALPQSKRVKKPMANDVSMLYVLGVPVMALDIGGSVMVLKKMAQKDPNK